MDYPPNPTESLQAIAGSLQQLQPVASESDPAELFYRAGIAVGRAQTAGTARWHQAAQFVAAALVACAIVAPASYRLGQNSGARAVAEAESAVALPERSETSSETSVAKRAPPESAPPASGDAAPKPPVIKAPKRVTAITENIASGPSRSDFWHRWIQLETILGGRETELPAAQQPLGRVLTASHSPEALEQWLEDRESFSLSGDSKNDRPERNASKTKVAPRASTLSVGDARRWGEIPRDSLGE